VEGGGQMVQTNARGCRRLFAENVRRVAIAAVALGAVITLGASASLTFAAGMAEEDVPATSIVPDSTEGAPEPPSEPPTSKSKSKTRSSATTTTPTDESEPVSPKRTSTSTKTKPTTHHASSHTSSAPQHVEVEPATARLKLIQETPAYSSPSKKSRHLEQLHSEKFVNVTGSTKYFLQVKLKNGEVAYVEPSAVELIKTTDKIFQLTHDAAVLEKPNRWAKKIAEVHQPHNVHVIGLALDYMMIRMKSGLVGFIPLTALQ
jgi:hypothetical protein